MTSAPIRSSLPDRWSSPRPFSDATTRRLKHGAVQPMVQPGFFERWFGQR